MLDSVTHSTFLPNPAFCDPLMSWTDLFSNEEYYPAFEHQTGVYVCSSRYQGSWQGLGEEVLALSRQQGLRGPGMPVIRGWGRPRWKKGQPLAGRKALDSSL